METNNIAVIYPDCKVYSDECNKEIDAETLVLLGRSCGKTLLNSEWLKLKHMAFGKVECNER